jgi:hypothetical protein
MVNEYQFERFLRAVHLRMVLLRGVERIGICLLGGCAVALILMPILIWRGQGTGEFVGVTLGAAALAGLGWAVAVRPTKLAAAMEADQQLRLSDLLGTALALRRESAVDEIGRTVLAMAEARCAQASPSAVVLNRLGTRSWGGIALAGALVLGVSLMGGKDRSEARAAAAAPRTWQEIEAAQEKDNVARFASTPDLRRAKSGGGDDDDPLNSPAVPQEQSSGSVAANEASRNGAGGAQEGSGAGAGQSASKGGTATPRNSVAGGNAKTNGTVGETSGGGGGTASEGGNKGAGLGGTAGENQPRRPAPVWRAQGWPADQDAARTAIRDGRVPDAYRDLVRDYFERE